MKPILGSQILKDVGVVALREADASDYDVSLVHGNRDKVNSALQDLDFAIRNLKHVEDHNLKAAVRDLEMAYQMIVKYNKVALKVVG